MHSLDKHEAPSLLNNYNREKVLADIEEAIK